VEGGEGLAGHELLVNAPDLEELVMRALFGNSAL